MRTLQHWERRRGFSLTEALIAIFIMAIGLISLLALFPVAALQMAAAFKDERSGQLAANADYMARLIWKNAWINQINPPVITTASVPERLNNESTEVFALEPFIQSLDQPSGATAVPTTSAAPSWPVFVDPIGFSLNSGNNQNWVAGLQKLIPRQTFGSRFLAGTVASRIRMTTLLDDISFAPGGGAVNPSTNQVERAGRYNCAWLFQRLRNSARTDVNVHVVVYQNRPPTDIAAKETSFSIIGNTVGVSVGTLTIDISSGRPNLRTGGWVLLAGQFQSGGSSPVTVTVAEFARVAAISEPATGQMQLELQTPTRNLVAYTGVVIVLDGVAEVFDRGTISATAPTSP